MTPDLGWWAWGNVRGHVGYPRVPDGEAGTLSCRKVCSLMQTAPVKVRGQLWTPEASRKYQRNRYVGWLDRRIRAEGSALQEWVPVGVGDEGWGGREHTDNRVFRQT